MGSIAILGCRLQPLAWVGHVSWGPVAKGTDSGPPKHKRNPNRGHGGRGELFTCAKFQQKRHCFPPVSLPSGSLYPGEEVSDGHDRGHLAAPLHPSVFAQCDVGASVQV